MVEYPEPAHRPSLCVSLRSNDVLFPGRSEQGKACRVGFRALAAGVKFSSAIPDCVTGATGFPIFMRGDLLHRVTVKCEDTWLVARTVPGTQ